MTDPGPQTELRTYADILACYRKWHDEPNPAERGWTQRRGYAFEKILNALLRIEGLAPSTNYRPAGEEVDGSLVLDGRTYLLEAKWWKSPLPASQLYAFKGKLDGKLAGTLGVVISHSGFGTDAVDALVSGKGINMILFEGSDLEAIVTEQVSFTDALREKLRYAAEYGQPFLPIAPNATPSTDPIVNLQAETTQIIDVVVEGPSDEAGLRTLLEVTAPKLASRVAIWPALGISNLVPLTRRLTGTGHTDVTVFLDASHLEPAHASDVVAGLESSSANMVIFTPSFIDVLEWACDPDYYNTMPETSIRSKHARRMARHANPELLWQRTPELRRWLEERGWV